MRHPQWIVIVFALLLMSTNALGKKVTWWIETGTPEEILQTQTIDVFQNANPGIEIEISIQENLNDVLRTAILGKKAPDLLTTFGMGWNAPYIKGGFMEPLDEYAEKWDWESKLQAWALEAGKLNGKLYALPFSYETIIVLYNKSLFDEKNYSVPTNLKELEELANALKKDNIQPFSYGKNPNWWNTGHLMTGYLNNAMKLEDLQSLLRGNKKWTGPEMTNAIKLFNKHMIEESWWSGGVQNYYQMGNEDFYTALASREAAMVMVGTWSFSDVDGYFNETGDDWDWFPIPSMVEGQKYNYSLGVGSSLAVNSNSDVKDEAAKFLDFLLSDISRAMALAGGYNYGQVIPIKITADDFPKSVDQRIKSYHADFSKVTTEGRYGYTNYTFWPSKANNHMRKEIEGVWEEMESLEDYLQKHQDIWDELREKGETIPIP